MRTCSDEKLKNYAIYQEAQQAHCLTRPTDRVVMKLFVFAVSRIIHFHIRENVIKNVHLASEEFFSFIFEIFLKMFCLFEL